MLAALPPSSRVSRRPVPASRRWICLPTSVDPVNATLSSPAWPTSADPTSPAPGQHVEHPGRQPGLGGDLGQHQRGQRGGLGRLEHDGVAAGQRGGDLPGRHQQREVPRDHRADHAERARVGTRPWPESPAQPSLSAQPAWWNRCADAVGTSTSRDSRIGLPLSRRLQHGQLAGPLGHDAGDPEQVLGPLGAGHRAPGLLERPPGGGHRAIHVGLVRRCRPRPAPPRWPG